MNHTHREKFQRFANTVIFSLTTNHSPPARGYGQRRLGYYHFIPPMDRFTEIEYKKLYVATSIELVRNTNT